MRPTFLARLVNGPLFDPVVFVRLLNTSAPSCSTAAVSRGCRTGKSSPSMPSWSPMPTWTTSWGSTVSSGPYSTGKSPCMSMDPKGSATGHCQAGFVYLESHRRLHLEITIHEVTDHEISVCSVSARDGSSPGRRDLFAGMGPPSPPGTVHRGRRHSRSQPALPGICAEGTLHSTSGPVPSRTGGIAAPHGSGNSRTSFWQGTWATRSL
jgi:hypothetical protein